MTALILAFPFCIVTVLVTVLGFGEGNVTRRIEMCVIVEDFVLVKVAVVVPVKLLVSKSVAVVVEV